MSSISTNNKEEIIDVKIKNQKIADEINLVSSEQRIVNNTDNSISIDNTNQNYIFNNAINENEKNIDLIYGVPYDIKYPKKIGNLKVFFYFKTYPIIVIGPECKYNSSL